jgi:polyisoprenoid-binding protein YceI
VEFTVDATGFAAATGTMRVMRGQLDLDPAHPEQARLDLTLDAASIDTGFPARDQAIRGGQFLDTTSFPEIRFTTSAVYPDRAGKAMVLGELEMLGVRRALTIDTRLDQAPEADEPIRFSGATRLARSDWGMTAFLPLVGDEVRISFQLTAVPSP